MPHFVTDILAAHRAVVVKPASSTPSRWRADAARAHRARLTTLRERAPVGLRVRVRRELHAAAARIARSE